MNSKHSKTRLTGWCAAAFCLTCLQLGRAQAVTYTNPVLPGDYPDPSVIRAGKDYWATATTSQWGPVFPLLHSRDLVNWQTVGAVFPKPPEWSAGSYWAPEIAEDRGRFYVFYTARKKNGPLCVAVATAPQPRGPYTDRGPLVCQEVGSIDAMPIRDENGQRYLVWKEDGNSRKLPTPLWAQPLSEDGLKLVGERKEILRNEAPWEAHLIEGPFILRRQDWFYMFYSADACCGRNCNYKLGVARSRKLLGPWERNPANPILSGNDAWKCPGHGSIVTHPKGRHFLLYHAYHPKDFQYAGRQGLLDEVKWGADGWPVINDGKGPSARASSPFGTAQSRREHLFFDDFKSRSLVPGWQWPYAFQPEFKLEPSRGGRIILVSPKQDGINAAGTVVARPTTLASYQATAALDVSRSSPQAVAGLAAFGDRANALGVSASSGQLLLWKREKEQQQTLATVDLPKSSLLYLRLNAREGERLRFAFSVDGKSWEDIGQEADGSYLPPWDLAVRVALTCSGPPGSSAEFDWLRIEPR